MFHTGTYDRLFKDIILENDNLDYVKNIIEMVDKTEITYMEVLNAEILVKKKDSIKATVDVLLKCDDNIYLLEMNKYGKSWIYERNYHNLYKCGDGLYKSGEKRNKKRKLVLINFDNFDYYGENKLIYKAKPIEESILQVDNENLIIYHINLEYLEKVSYNKDISELTMLERYLLLLLVKDKDKRNQIAGGDEILKKVNETINEYNAKDYNEIFGSQELAWEETVEGIAAEGEAKGRAEGEAKGRAEGITETAKYNIPIDVDTIGRRGPRKWTYLEGTKSLIVDTKLVF